MIPTYGLTHISLVVRDLERTLHFYEKVVGMAVVFRQPGVIQAQTRAAANLWRLRKIRIMRVEWAA